VVSPDILLEYADVLQRPKIRERHRRSAAQIEQVVSGFGQFGVVVEPTVTNRVVPEDPDDDMLFAAAVEAGAHLVVSNDPAVQAVGEYRGIRVVSPAAFLALLEIAQ
jgi:putative PIN family toxin of toxin-antitoxin system